MKVLILHTGSRSKPSKVLFPFSEDIVIVEAQAEVLHLPKKPPTLEELNSWVYQAKPDEVRAFLGSIPERYHWWGWDGTLRTVWHTMGSAWEKLDGTLKAKVEKAALHAEGVRRQDCATFEAKAKDMLPSSYLFLRNSLGPSKDIVVGFGALLGVHETLEQIEEQLKS